MTRPADGAERSALPVPPALPPSVPPYGAAELKRLARPHLTRALVGASVLHLAAIGLGAALLRERPAEAPAPPRDLIDITLPPPSIERPAPSRAAPTAAPTPRRAEVRAVADAQAPPDTADVLLTPRASVEAGEGSGEPGTPSGSGAGPAVAIQPPPPVDPPVVQQQDPPKSVDPPEPRTYAFVERMPVVAEQVQPTYPQIARQAGIEGRVFLKVRVSETGRVTDVQVQRSDNGLFDASAVEAVRQWRFEPGVQAGRPVAVWVTIPVRFRINGR